MFLPESAVRSWVIPTCVGSRFQPEDRIICTPGLSPQKRDHPHLREDIAPEGDEAKDSQRNPLTYCDPSQGQ